MNKKFTYIELFAGAGGLAEGFIKAGFQPVVHIDLDKYACLTLKTRLGYHYLKKSHKSDIYLKYLRKEISRDEYYSSIPYDIITSVINRTIEEDNIEELFHIIEKKLEILNVNKVDVIAGGPPCQAYSLVGRARSPYKMKQDPRNYLYKLYVKFLRRFKPDIFVFENVPGLLSAGNGKLWKDVQLSFKKAGYEIEYRLLNAYDSGVLQNRKRIIVTGWRKNIPGRYPDFNKDENIKKYRVTDVFDDLPPIEPGDKIYTGEYISKPSEYLVRYKIRNSEDILTLHLARGHNTRDREIYKFYIEAWQREKRRPEYDEIPEELKTHRNRNSFKDRFKVVAGDLPYSQTIVAHLSRDGHYFIHPDIKQLRSISVREAARLQSFPDNYYFEGPMTAMFTQIGNAVPPLMAEKIAGKIREMLK